MLFSSSPKNQHQLLPEIKQIEQLLAEFPDIARGQILGEVGDREKLFPIYKIALGSKDPKAPVLGFVGGVHGLERIGAQVLVSLLRSLLHMQQWDISFQEMLTKIRLVFIPTVNPWGIYHRRRSNAQGVDLMRNAPVEGEGKIPWLLGGQLYSPNLPWYRGLELQTECKLVLNAIESEIRESSFAWTVDVHSGFGVQDQIWFPYAYSTKPIPDLAEIYRFRTLFESTHPNHFYKIEPQTYRTHGDLWDYAYDQFRTPDRFFLPLTLELGSWIWVKKSPLQIFSREGLFYPSAPHRQKRILRRHWTLFDFMMRMTNSYQNWTSFGGLEREKARAEARTRGLELWYAK